MTAAQAMFPAVRERCESILMRALGHPLVSTLVCALALLPSLLKVNLPGALFPVSGVEALRSALPAGRIYNFYAAAGPLIYFGSDSYRLHVDGRLYLFDRDFWIRYGREARGEVPLEDLIAQYKPDAFYLWKPFQGRLSALIAENPLFQRVFEDASDVVYVKVGSALSFRSSSARPIHAGSGFLRGYPGDIILVGCPVGDRSVPGTPGESTP